MTELIATYIPPEPSNQVVEEAKTYTRKITNGHSMMFIRQCLLTILLENARLFAEVNEHRAARGIMPRKQWSMRL